MLTVRALFDDRRQAERAVKEIKDAGIDKKEISIVSKEENFGDKDRQGMKMTIGATIGGTIGLFF